MTDETRCEPPREWQDETPPEDWGDECASCPFCGSVEIRPWTDDETGNHMMWCYTCGADGPPADNDADAEERWNRRVTPPAVVAALVEALEWFIDNDDTNEGDTPLPEHGGRTWNEINAYWLDGLNKARAAIAAYREAGR